MYQKHVFVCENRRDNGERCCARNADGGAPVADGAVKFLRDLLKAEGLHGHGKTRINRAGCFDRCAQGPALVIYPQARWYHYHSAADLQEIARQDIIGNTPVPRLLLE